MRSDEFYDLMIDAAPDECVRWHGAHASTGYGQVFWHGRTEDVHVIACEYAHGPRPIIGHIEVRHACRNRDCFNPHHLCWGTVSENQKDRLRDGTQRRAILTLEQGNEVRRRRAAGASRSVVAAEFGVSETTIGRITRLLL